MSSSTTLTFIFPELTTLEVTIGNGTISEYITIAPNKDVTYEGSQALSMMMNSNIVGLMTRFDQSILNLLIDRHIQHDHVRLRDCIASGNECYPDLGVYLTIAIHR